MKSMDYIAKIKEKIRTQETEERYNHTLQTKEVCLMLAERFSVDSTCVTVAALWHDIARSWSDAELLSYTKEHHLEALEHELAVPMLLHGLVGAHLFVSYPLQGPFTEEQKRAIWLAIRWHTTGQSDMGVVGYVLFIADYIEPGRKHLTDDDRNQIVSLTTLEDMIMHILDMQFMHFEKKGISCEGPAKLLYRRLNGR